MIAIALSALASAAAYRGVLHLTSKAAPGTIGAGLYVVLGGGGPRPEVPK